jgi:hypothetical protein
VVLRGLKAQAVKDFLHAVIDIVGVVVAEQFVEAVVPGCQSPALVVIRGLRQGLGSANHVVVGGEILVEGCPRLAEQSLTGIHNRLLLQQGGTGARVPSHLAVVRAINTCQQPQQCGLAHAIGSNQPDPIAGVQFKANVLEKRAFIKPATEAGTAQ